MSARRIRFASTRDGQRVAFAESGSGPPYVYLQSVGHIQKLYEIPAYRAFVARVAEHYHLIEVELRGQGLSQPGEFGLENWIQDLGTVIESLGIEQTVLHAHTHGCAPAALYASRHPERVRHLILQGPYVRGAEILSGMPAGSMRRLRNLDFDLWAETVVKSLDLSGEVGSVFLEILRVIGPAGFNSLDDLLQELDLTSALPEIRVPALVIGLEGGGVSAQMSAVVAAIIPGAEFAVAQNHWNSTEVMLRHVVEPVLSFVEAPGPARLRDLSAFRTILFTDVVSSTPLLAQLKDEKMRAVMRDHDEVMEAAVRAHGGRVIKTIGDAVMAEFSVPSAAVRAAIDAQQGIRERFAASDVPIRIRVGINAGEPIEEGGDLHGASVVIAKRLESAAGDNGILVSDVVKQAVAGKDFEFEDRGSITLKGFDEPVRAWAVRWERG